MLLHSWKSMSWLKMLFVRVFRLILKGNIESPVTIFILALFFLVIKFELITSIVSFCSNALLNLEKSIGNTFSRRSHVKPQRTDDYDCTLCLKLLYEPITTPCGHSFCRSCLFQTMDRGVVSCLLLFVFLSPLCTKILFD